MVIIERDAEYKDSVRAYQVLIDNLLVGEINAAETRTFVVAPGVHTIRLRIDWCGSQPIQFVAAMTPTYFECGNNLRGLKVLLALMYITVWRDDYLWLAMKR